ncbi:MAG: class I SAM-dependent methyltransferase [Anaerolineae bacterium]|nr:class I SAM-dependent methyltransferase [Anaerolineae bacterium]
MRMLLYRFKERFKHLFPVKVKKAILELLGLHITRNRRETNAWLRQHAADVTGDVIAIGAGSDSDKEGRHYRDYFSAAASYTTTDLTTERGAQLVVDARHMPEIADGAYHAVVCGSVLEHVDDYRAALSEMTRILKPGGVLILGLPFRQALHLEPHDYWRFTEHGIRYLLKEDYDILRLDPVDYSVPKFPASYWVKARKR